MHVAAGVVQRLGDGERQHFWQAPTAAHREKMKLLLRQFEQADSSPVDMAVDAPEVWAEQLLHLMDEEAAMFFG